MQLHPKYCSGNHSGIVWFSRVHGARLQKLVSGLALMVIISVPVCSQKKNYRFNYYTTEDGLTQNMVDCIFKDSRGFMWFGTWNGLNRFDGYSFRNFSAQDSNKYSLSSNFIYDMGEDRYGNLWIATSGGLHVYLYEKEIFKHYRQGQPVDGSISSDHVNTLLPDRDGTLWIGTDRGLDKAVITDKEGGLKIVKSWLTDANMNVIYQDQAGRIWLGTGEGLALLDSHDLSTTFFRNQDGNEFSLSGDNVLTILQDSEGQLWVGTDAGLNRMEPGSTRFERFFHDPLDETSLIHNSVEDLAEDPAGNLVVGTLGGISVLDGNTQTFYNYSYNSHLYTELNNEFVNCLFADEEGNIWIGTERGGINQYNVFQNEFEYFVSLPGESQSLSNNTINSVWEDDRALWVGTAGGGLNKINRATGEFTHFRYDATDPVSISSDFITSIYRDRTGALLVGTWGSGINILTEDEGTDSFLHLQQVDGDRRSLVNNFVSSLVEDPFGRIWIGTFGGVACYDPGNRTFMNIEPSATGITRVGCLDFDLHSNLWIGTEEGLFYVPADPDKPSHLDFSRKVKYVNKEEDPGSISGDYVISMFDDRLGNLWFGTYGGGLNKLSMESIDLDDRQFEHFTESDGLCNNTIYGIQEDNLGNLWLSTDYGLSRFTIRTRHFTNYFTVDGLLDNQFYWSSSFRNSSGTLYFGSMKGLLCFEPGNIEDPAGELGTILTDFKIYNQKVEVGSEIYDQVALSRTISVSDHIMLSYRVKEFSLDFTALHFEHPDKVYYAYMMKGFDEDWHYVDSRRRYASYTNLEGGEYTFLVKASLMEGYFPSDPRELKITIIPPFWVRSWFIAALMLVLVSTVVFYNRFRVYTYRKRQKDLEQEVATRTALIRGQKEQLEKQNAEILDQRDKLVELNRKVQQANQQQMRFFTHMSHEFKTPLTLIIAPLEQMIRETSSRSPNYKALLLVKRNTQRLLHLINQLMEVRRIRTGKRDLRATKGDLVYHVETITQSFFGLAEQKSIIYDFKAYPGTIETYFDRDKLENILFNLLSNAFKYTPEGGQILVSLGIVKERNPDPGEVAIIGPAEQKLPYVEEYAEIRVMDTGYGIDEHELKNVFRRFFKIPVAEVPSLQGSGIGLYLTKELIKTHKGQLFIHSTKGEGTTFTILLPLGSGFLDLEEIVVEPDRHRKVVPKLHVDLLADRIQQEGSDRVNHAKELNREGRNDSRILIIDDDPDMMNFTADYLSERYQILTARDGSEGLTKAKQYLPDLIISDIIMPHMDGIQLCEQLKSDILTSHIPIILLTSRSEVEDFLGGLEAGALDYIAKPFDIQILEAKVHNHINNQERLKRLFTSTRLEDLRNVRKVKVQDPFLEKVILQIEGNLADPQFGVKELASELCVSRSLLHKKLISSVEMSASNFISTFRLKKAALLLLEGEQKVSQVAFEVGFNDPKYFSKIFKRYFGSTPTEFVEENIAV